MSSYAIFLGVLPVVLDLGFSVLGAVLLTSPSTLLVDRRVSKTRVDGRSSPRSAQGQGEVRVFDLPLAALEPFHVPSFLGACKGSSAPGALASPAEQDDADP